MTIGMLWLLDDKKPLEEALRQGLEHFRGKYGRDPAVCCVHPATLANFPGRTIDGMKVEDDPGVLRGLGLFFSKPPKGYAGFKALQFVIGKEDLLTADQAAERVAGIVREFYAATINRVSGGQG